MTATVGETPEAPPLEIAEAPSGRQWSRGARLVVLAALLVAAAAALLVLRSGLSLFVVESPSMGRAAPVGTLIVAERVDIGRVRVGDIVTYRPRGSAVTTTHRVVRIVDGGVETRGDINGAADAVTVRSSMLVGRAVAVVPGAGRLMHTAPWFGIGLVSIWLLTWPLRNAELRGALRLIGTCGVVTVLLALQHPMVGWSVLTQRPTGGGLAALVVSTGLLPVRIDVMRGDSVTLAPGAASELLLPADSMGRVRFDASLGLEPWGWAMLICCCLAPMVLVLVFGLPRRDDRLVRPA